MWESQAPPTLWQGWSLKEKGVAPPPGEIPFATPLPKGAGSSPFANIPNGL